MASPASPSIFAGASRLLFVIGAVVSATSAGRLLPLEMIVAMGSFLWFPVVQLFAVAVAVRAVSRTIPLREAFAAHLARQSPAIVLLLGIAALALLLPAESTARILLRVVPLMVLAALVCGAVLRYVCFRRVLALSAARAAIATAIYTAAIVAVVVAYYLAMGQLGPLLS